MALSSPWPYPAITIAGVAWFEVDRRDVLAAKQRTLSAAGAEVAGSPSDSETPSAAHPLLVHSWRAVDADLGDPDWAQTLKSAGFDPGLATIWVLEGLVMCELPSGESGGGEKCPASMTA